MNGEQAFTIRFVLVWWHGASMRSEKAVLQGREAVRNELTGGICRLPVVEQHGTQSRQLRPQCMWRPARGWPGREGWKPTAERGCRYVMSVVCVCPHPNMRGSQPNRVWLLLAAVPPFSLPPAALSCQGVTWGKGEHRGAVRLQVVPPVCANLTWRWHFPHQLQVPPPS